MYLVTVANLVPKSISGLTNLDNIFNWRVGWEYDTMQPD